MPNKKHTKALKTNEIPLAAEEDQLVNPFPIVGIGASAGGLAAFEAFFSGMPPDSEPGMAFVLVQHLAPDHKSILSELIRRYTRMQVFEIEDGMAVQINCVYIIPPNHDLAFLNGTLQLLEPLEPRGQRLPIDYFFRSLAQDLHERAIGIILSGTGSDGTQGIRAIKGEGGLVLVQTPTTTEFNGMPRSAIATGLVDYELPPVEMPARLLAYTHRTFNLNHQGTVAASMKSQSSLKKIFVLLRAQTGHDFSHYKPSTIYRRIERRMAVHQLDSIENYVKYLQTSAPEVEALFRDFLIGVTNFFRDTEAFRALEDQIIPQLFANKSPGGLIRIWATGCSTGEEAYSIAILLVERMEALKQSFTIQVFATDIDSRAIATARAGLYPSSIAADVSPERLARFFTAEPDGSAYRIHRGIRDLLIFSEQNVIKDPPFSKLDLITCRNLIIYLDAELQKKLIPLFYYALKPNGFLFLGSSEGVGEFTDLFDVLDRKSKLYQRKDDFQGIQRNTLGRFLPSITAMDATLRNSSTAKTTFPVKLPLRELTEQALLRQLAPASALVNAKGDILYLHGRTGQFLEPTPGEASVNNILKMARPGLSRDLTIALNKAVGTKEKIVCPGLSVKNNGHFTWVNLSVCPVHAGIPEGVESSLFLVMLEETAATDPKKNLPALEQDGSEIPTPVADLESRIEALKQELRAKDEYIQVTQEELESSTEELKSSNEEMQSVNEELQSTNEELETSKEEMQSVNEELATVNIELQNKVQDLSRANNDMNNLLAGTGIGTVFVDHQLRILRFTPAASSIINLITSDVGRPIGHIVSNIVAYDRLVTDIRSVLDTLVSIEIEVLTTSGNWYTMHIQPYRTLDNVIEGAVISFLNITEMVHTREALKKAHEQDRLAAVVRDSFDAITVQDLDGQTLAWNPAAERFYGWTEKEALLLNARDRIPVALRKEELAILKRLSKAETLQPHCTQRLTKTGEIVEVSIISTPLFNHQGELYAVATTERINKGGVSEHPE